MTPMSAIAESVRLPIGSVDLSEIETDGERVGSTIAQVHHAAIELPNLPELDISAGPVRTLAASGISGFKRIYSGFAEVAPLRTNITPEDVGKSAVYLASDLSSAVTGETLYVDGGLFAKPHWPYDV